MKFQWYGWKQFYIGIGVKFKSWRDFRFGISLGPFDVSFTFEVY